MYYTYSTSQQRPLPCGCCPHLGHSRTTIGTATHGNSGEPGLVPFRNPSSERYKRALRKRKSSSKSSNLESRIAQHDRTTDRHSRTALSVGLFGTQGVELTIPSSLRLRVLCLALVAGLCALSCSSVDPRLGGARQSNDMAAILFVGDLSPTRHDSGVADSVDPGRRVSPRKRERDSNDIRNPFESYERFLRSAKIDAEREKSLRQLISRKSAELRELRKKRRPGDDDAPAQTALVKDGWEEVRRIVTEEQFEVFMREVGWLFYEILKHPDRVISNTAN